MADHDEHPGATGFLGRGDRVEWRNRALALFDRVPVPCAVCLTDGRILLANPAIAVEWGVSPGRLPGRNILELFHPRSAAQIQRIVDAVRLGRRSRYPVEVQWAAPGGGERHGELTADVVSDSADSPLWLLVVLKVLGEYEQPAARRPPDVSDIEARILALAAGGRTTAQIAREVALTTDGVNYHLGRLSRRWGAGNRTELVARAYVLGVLAPGEWPPAPA